MSRQTVVVVTCDSCGKEAKIEASSDNLPTGWRRIRVGQMIPTYAALCPPHHTEVRSMTTLDMATVKRVNMRAGQHWFEPASMRFFRSRVGSTAYQSGRRAWFVSSEQFEDGRGYRAPRLYSVRVIDLDTGSIDTVGEFQQYASRNGADAAARRLAQTA